MTRSARAGSARCTPDGRERLLAACAESDRTFGVAAFRARLCRPGGEVRAIRGRNTPLRDAGGAVAGFLSTVEDVTETRAPEPAAAVGEHQYRLMFTHMQNGLALHRIILDDQGRPVDYEFLAVNPAYTEMTGLKPESTIGRRVTELLPGTENDPANWIGQVGAVALSGRRIRLEAFSQAIGKWFEVRAYRPEPMQFAALIHEITDRKQLEWALLEVSSREQQRLGRELHDGLGQEITGVALLAEGVGNAPIRLPKSSADHLYRIAQEALSNAFRYADAAHVVLRLTVRADSMRLEIEDDGKGCGTTAAQASGIGMKTMRYRAQLLGGEFSIAERAEGGTRVVCTCPQPPATASDVAGGAPRGALAAG